MLNIRKLATAAMLLMAPLIYATPANAREVLVDTRYVSVLAAEKIFSSWLQIQPYTYSSAAQGFDATSRYDLNGLWQPVVYANPGLPTRFWLIKGGTFYSGSGSGAYQPQRPAFYVNERNVPVTQDWVADNFELLMSLSSTYDVALWVK